MNEDTEDLSPDEVCDKYTDLGVKITVTDLDPDVVLIEGTREGLEFLAELFWAQAHDSEDDAKQLWPTGPGSALFTKTSTRGFYIRRIDPDSKGETAR